MANKKRVMKDLKAIQDDKDLKESFGIYLDGSLDNLSDVKAIITGPKDTPYEKGLFQVRLLLSDFPFKPPHVNFITTIWHPNVSLKTGTICLDVLGSKWLMGMTLRYALMSIQAMMETPNPLSPLNCIAGRLLQNDPLIFKKTAEMWTHILASGPSSDSSYMDKLQSIRDMSLGKDDENRLQALTSSNWVVKEAVNKLLHPDPWNDDDYDNDFVLPPL